MTRLAWLASHLVRAYVSWTADHDGRGEVEAAEVREALRALRDAVGPERRFSVLLFPLMRPRAEWPAGRERSYRDALEILRELEIRSFDLWPVVEQALADQIEVQENPPRDPWHPSEAVARRIAEFLEAEDLL